MYLPFASDHQRHIKLGIWRSESTRALINNSAEAGFRRDLDKFRSAFLKRGYPEHALAYPCYDADRRLTLLHKFEAHTAEPIERPRSKDIILILDLPYKGIPLKRYLHVLQQRLNRHQLDFTFKLVYRNMSNIFQQTYRYNVVGHQRRG